MPLKMFLILANINLIFEKKDKINKTNYYK